MIKLWSWPEGGAKFLGLQIRQTTIGILVRRKRPGRISAPPRVVLLHGVTPYRPRHAAGGLGWPLEDDDFGYTEVSSG